MAVNATWVLGTILTLLLQAAFVLWQMRYVRSFDRLTAPRAHQEDTPADVTPEVESFA